MGSAPAQETANGAVDPAQDEGQAAPGTGGMVTIGQCERVQGDVAVVDGRSLARIQLLAHGGIRA
jgi:hypothetical protein